MGLASKIVDEIREKMNAYESDMAEFMRRVGFWGDLFRVNKPGSLGKGKAGFSNPRLTEYHRAAFTLGSMVYRMQTAQDPFFDIIPMSPVEGSDQLLKIQGTLETQLQAVNYKENLLMADVGVAAFGTQIIQKDYEIIGINALGRRIPATTFKPRSLFQVAFDRSAMNIDDADWLTTSDLISDAGLMNLARESKSLGGEWNQKVLEHAAKEEYGAEEASEHLLNRLRELGYIKKDKCTRKELSFYYGKLDCLNDGVEYICGVINRKHLARFHPNKNQSGRRNFSVGYWIRDPLALDPLGIGIGHVAGGLHQSMDANRRRVQDGIAMLTYNMFYRLRSANIDDGDLKIRPLNIVDMDERDGMGPMKLNTEGPVSGLKLEELLRAEFQAATGATPTLQAQVTDATASEVSLAQNEAVRNISVKAENIAEPFVRQYLMDMHVNNVENIKKPFNINRSGYAGIVYPSDLKCDIDFRIKVTSDKDYKPKRLESLIQVLQTLISTKSSHPDQLQISIIPIVQEIARGLGVPAEKIIQQMPMGMPPSIGAGGFPLPSGPDVSALNGSTATIDTPVGNVMGSVTQ